MPLFMDRHDVPGASPEDVAEAHVRDLEYGPQFGVLFRSYWFDHDRGAVFCFADAPSKAVLAELHETSHGLVPNEIIPVKEDSVLRFLGKIEDPTDASAIENPFRTILFTDLAGSTELTNRLGIAEFMLLLTEHDLIIRRALVASNGREIKHTGDGINAAFDDAAKALQCALEIQQGFAARAETHPDPLLEVRLGLASGEPVAHNDDLYGAAVNLARRICDSADAGETLVSADVRALCEDRFAFADRGERSMKGFDEPIQVFELVDSS